MEYDVQNPPNGLRYVNWVPFAVTTVELSPPVYTLRREMSTYAHQII